MCGSNGMSGDCCCCPPAQFFQEKICGNFNNPVGTGGGLGVTVWSAPAGDYLEGTFEIFNSASSPGAVTGSVTSTAVPVVTIFSAPPGFSVSVSVRRPTIFTLTVPEGASGTYCITLYKRVLA